MARESGTIKQWLVWALFSSIVLWSSYRFLLTPPPALITAASYISYPVLLVQRSCIEPIISWKTNRKSIEELTKELSQSRADYGQLVAENVALESQLSFLQETQELCDFKARYAPDKSKLAQILARHFSQDSHYFYVDMGSNAGIETDMIVVHNNCLVGRVVEVFPWYSKVVLITDASCKVAAYCTTTKARGIHEGINQEHGALLKFVSHLAPIEIGDLLVSSGEGLVFPKGFALGKVKRSTLDGLYQQVEIEPMVDLEKLDYCLVLSKDMHELAGVEVPDVEVTALESVGNKEMVAVSEKENKDAISKAPEKVTS